MRRNPDHADGRSGTHRAPGIRRSPFVTLLMQMSGRHSWRLFAIPVLIVATVWAAMSVHGSAGPQRQRADAAVVPTRSLPATPTSTQPVTRSAASAPTSSPLPPATSARHPESSQPTKKQPSSAPTPALRPAYGELIAVPRQAGVAVCAKNAQKQHVFVSIGSQHAWMCEGRRLVRDTAVTTGAPASHDSTPLGSWLVQARQADRYLSGPGYSYRVNYWVPFNGDYGFHDASWQKMPFGVTGYRKLGSRGCVHMPTAQMQWFYQWVHVGSTVTVQA